MFGGTGAFDDRDYDGPQLTFLVVLRLVSGPATYHPGCKLTMLELLMPYDRGSYTPGTNLQHQLTSAKAQS